MSFSPVSPPSPPCTPLLPLPHPLHPCTWPPRTHSSGRNHPHRSRRLGRRTCRRRCRASCCSVLDVAEGHGVNEGTDSLKYNIIEIEIDVTGASNEQHFLTDQLQMFFLDWARIMTIT